MSGVEPSSEVTMCASVIELYLSGGMSESEFATACLRFKKLHNGRKNSTPKELSHVTEYATSTPKENVRIAVCSSCKRCMVTCRVFCPFCILLKKQVVYLFKGCNQPNCLANTSDLKSIITSLEGNESKCLNAFCYHVRRNSATGEYYYNHIIGIIGDLMSTGQFDAIRNTTRSEILETLKRCKEGNLICTLNCQNTISLFAHLGEKELAMAAADCCRDRLPPGDDTTLFEDGLKTAISKDAPEKLLFAEKAPAPKDIKNIRRENIAYLKADKSHVNAVDAILAPAAADYDTIVEEGSDLSSTDDKQCEEHPDELPRDNEEGEQEEQSDHQMETEQTEQLDGQEESANPSGKGKGKGDIKASDRTT